MKKKLVSLLLAVVMVASLMPSFVLNVAAADGKGLFSLVYLKPKAGAAATEFAYVEADKEEDYEVGDKFYVGVKMSDLTEISSIANTAFRTIGIGVNYEDEYLELEPTLGAMLASYNLGSVKDASNKSVLEAWWTTDNGDTTGGVPGRFYGRNSAFPYFQQGMGKSVRYTFAGGEKALVANDTGYENGNFRTVYFTWQTAAAATAAANQTTGDAYLIVLEFGVKKVPTTATKVLGFSHSGSNVTVAYGVQANGTYGSVQYDKTGAASDILNVFDFDDSAVDIFPNKNAKPILTATTKVEGNTSNDGFIYGDTLKVTVSSASLDTGDAVDNTKYGYQWQRSNGANWNNITNATNATYKLGRDDVGKQIRCILTSSAYDLNSTNTYTNSTAIDKRTVTLLATDPVWTVKDDTQKQYIWTDDTTDAELTKTISNFSYTPKNAADVNMVSGDKLRFSSITIKYTAQTTSGTQDVEATSFTLATSGTKDQNDYYQLATGTKATVKGLVKASNVKSVAVKTEPKKAYSLKEGQVDNILDLSALVVTLTYDSGKTKDVAFADFGTYGITTSPSNGATLTASNTSVTITCNEKNATQALTIATDDVLNSIAMKKQPTKALNSYEEGDAFDPAGLELTATWQQAGAQTVAYAAGNITFKFSDGSALPATFTAADSGKTIVAVYKEKEVNVGTLTVTVPAVDSVTVDVTGTFTKVYDGTKTVTNPADLDCTATGYTVTGTPVFEYEDVNVGTQNIKYVSGLSITGQENARVVITGLTGTITPATPTVTLGNLAQPAGSVTEVTAAATPKSDDDVITIEYEIVTKEAVEAVEGVPCDCSKSGEDPEEAEHDEGCHYVKEVTAAPAETEWQTWAEAENTLKALPAGSKVNVRAYAAGTKNYAAGSSAAPAATGELVLSARPSGGYVPPVPNHEAYIVGDDNGMFRPNDGMTRAEAAVILARVSDDFNETYAYSTTMRDAASHWGANYIGFAASKGIVTGRPDGTYDPNGKVTRAELAVMVARFIGAAPNNSAYAFADTNGHWAEGYIAALKAAGIVIGDGNGFRPDAAISRAEAVTMINRALERTPDAAKVQTSVTASPFYDVKRSDWFFAQVIEAAVAHKPADFHG